MDGYTVEEAASVLGVPRERVWELLARGIITGSADLGGAMRVRLKAEQPAAMPAPAPVERAADGGYGPSTEVTPFRELLTEFRSLTERYGQALLALGEARGEVAGLRSRVDMLEARVDLRLPSSATPISSSWSSTPWPTPTERVVQPPPTPTVEAAPAEEGATTAEHEEATAPAHDDAAGSHRRKGRAARRATERFADALARAEDPSLPELPGAEETAAALAALRQEHPSAAAPEPESDRDAEASLPRELPSADQVPVADEEVAAPDLTAAAAAVEVTAPIEEEGAAAEPAQATAAPVEPVAEAELEPQTEPEVELEVELEVEPTPVAAVGEGEDRAQDDPASGVEWDQERYSAAIEEPGWISADEADAPVAWSPPAEPEPPAAWSPPPEPETEPEPPADSAPTEPVGREPEATDVDEPAEDVPAWRRSRAEERSEASTAIHIESSGSRELDEGLAALDALANPQPPADDAGDTWDSGMDREAQPIGAPRPQAWVRSSPPPQLTTRSSASRAYRRLRRIFPT